MNLSGQIIERAALQPAEIEAMFYLMQTFYDDVDRDVFMTDLRDKDTCILLRNNDNEIVGFSTQKMLSFDMDGRTIHGVFSGDTIIHKDYWGSFELYTVFARFFFAYAKKFDDFYWFLISKGYKTYRMLPIFFKDYYPNRENATPDLEQSIMHGYAKRLYPEEYNDRTGVISYRTVKDKLKKGVADITEKELRNHDIRFFLQANPNYAQGDDLVCIARLYLDNLKPRAKALLFGE
jgi:hypothetical protein